MVRDWTKAVGGSCCSVRAVVGRMGRECGGRDSVGGL